MAVQDYLLAAALLLVAAICTFRMLVVINPEVSLTQGWATDVEPYLLNASRYPQIQMLVYGFGLMPFALLAAMSLWRRPTKGMAIWACIFAGLVAQGQFGHIVGSLHAASDPQFATSEGGVMKFWLSNLAVALVPLWFAWRYEQKLKGV